MQQFRDCFFFYPLNHFCFWFVWPTFKSHKVTKI